jgi:predicted MFS family arabinose efflux permease
MTKNDSSSRPSSNKNLTLFALASSAFASQPAGIITGLLLIDIGNTFNLPVGLTGQIRTLSPFIAFIVGLLMAGISLRFRHKSLLIAGLFCLGVSALLCGLAPDFTTMMISYSLNGLGAAMVVPMTLTLIGAYFPLDHRAGAISWIVSAQSMAYFIGTPIIGYLATLGGWRWAFFGFVLPVSFLCLVLASFCLPNESARAEAGSNSTRASLQDEGTIWL